MSRHQVSRSAFFGVALVAVLLLGTSCGGSGQTRMSEESIASNEQAGLVESGDASPDTGSSSSDEDNVIQAPPPPPPTPRFVLGHPTIRGKIFFAEELTPIRQAVEERLGAEVGVEVVSYEQVLADREIVKGGKLPGGKACDRLPDPLRVSQGLHQAQVADIEMSCDEAQCVLSISSSKIGFRKSMVLSGNSDNDDLIAMWSAEIRSQEWTDIPGPELDVLTPEVGKVRTPYLVLSNYEGIVEKDPAKPLQRAAKLAHRCEKQSASADPLAHRYVLEINANGRVGRCESDRPDRITSELHSCTCKALKRQVRYPRAKKGVGARRASMNLHVKAKDTDQNRAKNSRVELQFSESDDPIAHLGFSTIPVTKLARCADMVTEEIEVGISLEVAGQGEHVAHSTRWVGEVPDDVKACVKELVRGVKMTCPANDRATVKGKLVLRAPN